MIELEVVQHGQRGRRSSRMRVDRQSGHAGRLRLMDPVEEVVQRTLVVLPLFGDVGGTASPGRHDGDDDGREDQRNPAAGRDLQQVGGEDRQLDATDDDTEEDESPHGPVPRPVGQHQEQARRQQEGAGDGQAIGGGQLRRGLEDEDERQHADEEDPVDLRDVDLAALGLRGVTHAQTWQQSQTGRL